MEGPCDLAHVGGSADALRAQSPPGCTTLPRDRTRDGMNGWDGNCTIATGHHGSFTKAAQVAVQGHFINVGPIDCDYGSQTANGVWTFQGQAGITQDGIVGAGTWKALQGEMLYRYAGTAADHCSSGVDTSSRFWRDTRSPPAAIRTAGGP